MTGTDAQHEFPMSTLRILACLLPLFAVASCSSEESVEAPDTTTDGDVGTAGGGPAAVDPPPAAAADFASAAVLDARGTAEAATAFIEAGYLEKAGKAVERLESLRAQLPEAWGPKIDQITFTLEAKRAEQESAPPADG